MRGTNPYDLKTALALENRRHIEYSRSIDNYGTEKEILARVKPWFHIYLLKLRKMTPREHIEYFDMQIAESLNIFKLLCNFPLKHPSPYRFDWIVVRQYQQLRFP